MSIIMVLIAIVWLAFGSIAGKQHEAFYIVGLINSSVWCVGAIIVSQLI